MPAHLKYYEVLGLDAPPKDRKAVKRAYSKKLKVTRPEDDPEGFMRLRDAHDLALNIVAREAAYATKNVEQAIKTTPAEDTLSTQETEATEPNTSYAIGPTPSLDAPLTSPDKDEVLELDTTYAIGATPNFNAPVTLVEPEAPKAPPIIDKIEEILDTPKNYNDREQWNILFRKARQLDIDDFVDFEHLLLEKIMQFHGYYSADNPLFDTPEKMTRKLSPSIAASLFKTMSWDQVNTRGFHRGQQIEWLERRMQIHKRGTASVPLPETNSGGIGKIWLILLGLFFIAKLFQFLLNS